MCIVVLANLGEARRGTTVPGMRRRASPQPWTRALYDLAATSFVAARIAIIADVALCSRRVASR